MSISNAAIVIDSKPFEEALIIVHDIRVCHWSDDITDRCRIPDLVRQLNEHLISNDMTLDEIGLEQSDLQMLTAIIPMIVSEPLLPQTPASGVQLKDDQTAVVIGPVKRALMTAASTCRSAIGASTRHPEERAVVAGILNSVDRSRLDGMLDELLPTG